MASSESSLCTALWRHSISIRNGTGLDIILLLGYYRGSYQDDTLNRYSICDIAIRKITWFGKSGDSGYAIGSPLAYSQGRIYQVELRYWWQRKGPVKAWPKTVILETVGMTRTAPIYPYMRHLSFTTPQWEPLSTNVWSIQIPKGIIVTVTSIGFQPWILDNSSRTVTKS